MKKVRDIIEGIRIHIIIGCMLLVAGAAAADTYHVPVLQNPNWTSRLLISSRTTADVTVNTRGTECKVTVAGDVLTVSYAGTKLVEDFGRKQCIAGSGIGLATIETSGPVNLTTEAIFRDPVRGSVDTVAIPPLTAQIPAVPATGTHYVMQFDGIEAANGRTTSIAIIPDASAWVRLTVYDGDNHAINTTDAYVTPPYTLLSVTGVVAGRVELVEQPPQVGCGGCAAAANLYAVAFVSDGVGSPRVIPAVLSVVP